MTDSMIAPFHRETTIEAAVLRSRHVGQGAPILLAHGVPGDLESLAPVADALADRYHAITVSLRYAGPGPHGTRGFGTAEQLEDLRDLILQLDLGPVNLVAWSYSAHAALAMTSRHPDLIRSLLVYEPGFPTFVTDPAELDAVQQDTTTAFSPVFEALFNNDVSKALRHSIDAAAGTSGHFDAQPERLRAIHIANAQMLPLLLTQSPPIALGPEELGAIRTPTTIMWGQKTRACYRIVSQIAARLVPGANAVEVEGANHLFPETCPIDFAAHLDAHLANGS